LPPLTKGVSEIIIKSRVFGFTAWGESITGMTSRMKDIEIVEIVKRFLRSALIFKEVLKEYNQGNPKSSTVEKLVDTARSSPLFDLKERCHALFRYKDVEPFNEKERLFDLTVGSIFHESMKLKENLYQLEVYGPRYLELEKTLGNPIPEREFRGFMKIKSRAEQGLREGIEDLKELLRDVQEQLVELLKEYSKNQLLTRFLLENRALVQRVYGRKGLEKIFVSMYRGGIDQAYWIAGNSYLESQYFDMAHGVFKKALSRHPENEMLRFICQFSRGAHSYYASDYQRAMKTFKGLLRVKGQMRGRGKYLKKAEEICRKMRTEYQAEQDWRRARVADKIARDLREFRSQVSSVT
jgi:tetratricopeptide (TPR) repeat protein